VQARALLSAAAVRGAADRMLDLATAGSLREWRVDLDRLPTVADYVAALTRERFPRLDVPMHSRWRHFVFAGRDLWKESVARCEWPDAAARARAAFDLAITSVLLDAGAGSDWRYTDAATGIVATRSEGLALASLRWFESGALSDHARVVRRADANANVAGANAKVQGTHADAPGVDASALRADAAALMRVDAQALNTAFQVTHDNPLVGAAGRASLLNRLGRAVHARPDVFAIADSPRPGGLFDALVLRAGREPLRASVVLEMLLETLGPIWTGRPSLSGVSLGDCWPHPDLGYVPFHKLSQWLAYSLIEPLETAGVRVTGLDELTGLPEYRNGGLFVDMGVLIARDNAALRQPQAVSTPFVVELRSLTVALLDRVAPLVATQLGFANDGYRLARVLEGGTWAAGRRIAREKRGDGTPPFHISSDGTVL
jgi:hypothetical protein